MSYRISVIMGIYNCKDTLGEALESLLAQTYQNFKVIMCDDGSVDSTYKIACEYSKKYPEKFILLKNEKNITLGPTLNKCLECVDTEFVARMDADDISLPTRFEKQLTFLLSNPKYALVSTPMFHFNKKGVWRKGVIKTQSPSKKDFKFGNPFCHAPCMMRTTVLKSIGGYSEKKRHKRIEDMHLWYKLYKADFVGYNLLEPLYMMRDDIEAVKRRKFKYRVSAFILSWKIYSDFDIPIIEKIKLLKLLLIGLLPKNIYIKLREKNAK